MCVVCVGCEDAKRLLGCWHEYVAGTGIVSSASDVLGMSLVRGMKEAITKHSAHYQL